MEGDADAQTVAAGAHEEAVEVAAPLAEAFAPWGERQARDDDDVEQLRVEVAGGDDEGRAVDDGSIDGHVVVGAPGGELGEIGLARQGVVEQEMSRHPLADDVD